MDKKRGPGVNIKMPSMKRCRRRKNKFNSMYLLLLLLAYYFMRVKIIALIALGQQQKKRMYDAAIESESALFYSDSFFVS